MTKCPYCGKKMDTDCAEDIFGSEEATFDCIPCGITITGRERFEKLTAAMELARMEYALEHCEPQYEHEYQFHLELAQKRVLEVFGGE